MFESTAATMTTESLVKKEEVPTSTAIYPTKSTGRCFPVYLMPSMLCVHILYEDTPCVHLYTHVCVSNTSASADVNTEFNKLRRECQQLRSQLALVQSPEETKPTSAQLTGMLHPVCVPSMAYIGRWCVHICRTSWS